MDNLIAILIIVLIVTAALIYVIKAKKSGKKCIGCPQGCNCDKKGCCGNNK